MAQPKLKIRLKGRLYTDETTRRLYATDASAYRELPLAVAVPQDQYDLVRLVNYARENQLSLIPRTAGTSLAGQVVGAGIVVDMSQHFGKILEVNAEEGWAWVEPGIVRDDLNRQLKEHGLFFAPETSTANRAMIGGMIGNNSCGANSVVYGSTREHLLECRAILADGNEQWFGPLGSMDLQAAANSDSLSGNIYRKLRAMLDDETNKEEITKGYPKASIPRRNTGYALDMLLRQAPFGESQEPFNLCSLIAGSEGTLCLLTAAKVKLSPLPPAEKRLVCIHAASIDEALRANLIALNYAPSASELMDHYILEATKRNRMYEQNRFFVEGDPKAILVVELARDNAEEADTAVRLLIADLKEKGMGYAFPVVAGDNIKKVWDLRKAGLGLLSNVPGDAKAAPVIEDTAVDVRDLPDYIAEFNQILSKHDLYSVHYAHAGSGELHLRPIIDLKTAEGIAMFRTIAEEIADLVKKYDGSLSGEHGDGRLRGEFIPKMLGGHNYALCQEVKRIWDEQGIFNPGKIVDTPPMDTSLRYEAGQATPEVDTAFDFSHTLGYVRAAEQCNGSGDCRKSAETGGTMCPSYMATRREQDTTRARANILREMLSRSDRSKPFTSPEIGEVMDLCLSCKGCKSECPSNVDMARLKAEWQHQYYKEKGVPFRTRMIARFTQSMRLASIAPWTYRLAFGNKVTGNMLKSFVGFARKRSMPELSSRTLRNWYKRKFHPEATGGQKVLYLFCDEFTNYNDAHVGEKAILLLDRLGYTVRMIAHPESGRTYLSKGLLGKAKKLAAEQVSLFAPLVSESTPLVGLEPSAILTFRDEYPDLLRDKEQVTARELAKSVYTIEEFLARELDAGRISAAQFSDQPQLIKVHGHCHQKALSSMTPTKKILSLPANYTVHMINSGCCGMAGSFGYEEEHYALSMQVGELVLFPTVRQQAKEVIIAAAGTSCRHQIKDGTGRKALHPVEILYDALA